MGFDSNSTTELMLYKGSLRFKVEKPIFEVPSHHLLLLRHPLQQLASIFKSPTTAPPPPAPATSAPAVPAASAPPPAPDPTVAPVAASVAKAATPAPWTPPEPPDLAPLSH